MVTLVRSPGRASSGVVLPSSPDPSSPGTPGGCPWPGNPRGPCSSPRGPKRPNWPPSRPSSAVACPSAKPAAPATSAMPTAPPARISRPRFGRRTGAAYAGTWAGGEGGWAGDWAGDWGVSGAGCCSASPGSQREPLTGCVSSLLMASRWKSWLSGSGLPPVTRLCEASVAGPGTMGAWPTGWRRTSSRHGSTRWPERQAGFTPPQVRPDPSRRRPRPPGPGRAAAASPGSAPRAS